MVNNCASNGGHEDDFQSKAAKMLNWLILSQKINQFDNQWFQPIYKVFDKLVFNPSNKEKISLGIKTNTWSFLSKVMISSV
jgi:hypothetical protein